MSDFNKDIREELVKRLRLLDDAEVIILAGIAPFYLEVARASGALRYIKSFDGRHYYEEGEVLVWLKGRKD